MMLFSCDFDGSFESEIEKGTTLETRKENSFVRKMVLFNWLPIKLFKPIGK